jgi:hypothetical protein
LSANGVWLKSIEAPVSGPATIVLNDIGKKAAAAEVSERVNRGEQVLALDLLFVGDAWKGNDPSAYGQILNALGDRTIGLEAAQLIIIANWLRTEKRASRIRLQSTGIRNQVISLVAAGIEPNLFSELIVHEGMQSLGYLLDTPCTDPHFIVKIVPV